MNFDGDKIALTSCHSVSIDMFITYMP